MLSVLALAAAACSGSDAAPAETESEVTTESVTTDMPPTATEAPPVTEAPATTNEPTPPTTEGLQPSLFDVLDTVEPSFAVTPGVEQLTITGATPETLISFVTTEMAEERLPPGTTIEPPVGVGREAAHQQ